jgi:hypothetical protein
MQRYNISKTAKLLGLPESQIRKAIDKKLLPVTQVRGQWLVTQLAISNFRKRHQGYRRDFSVEPKTAQKKPPVPPKPKQHPMTPMSSKETDPSRWLEQQSDMVTCDRLKCRMTLRACLRQQTLRGLRRGNLGGVYRLTPIKHLCSACEHFKGEKINNGK